MLKPHHTRKGTVKNYYRLIQGDCLNVLPTLGDKYVDLIVTSPPYNIGKNYKNYDDSKPFDAYYGFTEKWIQACFVVLKNNGRFVLNLPENPKEPIYQRIVNIACRVGFQYLVNVIWYKKGVRNRQAWGSWLSPSAPMIIPPFEYITVFYKGEYKKHGGESDISKSEFINYTFGWWDFGSAKVDVDHPSSFPEELPKRCIKLFSYINDIVLDPFLGSGTTMKVAQDLRRSCIGIEISPDYCELARRRCFSRAFLGRELPEYRFEVVP